MAKQGTIRCYDYVNHPYEEVRKVLGSQADQVFRNATRTAASRAQSVASELHINIGGIEIGTDISISVKKIEDHPKQLQSPPITRLQLEWEAAKMPKLFPLMKAELSIYPLTSTETQLDLSGNYEVPLGTLGVALDSVIGHRIAEASVLRFVNDIAAYLRAELTTTV